MQEPKTLEGGLKTIIDNYIERTADLVVEDGKNFGNKHFLKIDMQVSIEQLIKQEQENESEGVRIEGIPCRCLYAGTSHSLSCPKIIKRPRRKTYTQSQVDRLIKQARADQLKKLWNATQHDIVPEGTPPRDMSEELHKMIKELEK